MNHYYAKWIGSEHEGRWNVIQVIDLQARYFVLKTANLEKNAETFPFLSHGWIEKDEDVLWFTDGEDYVNITDWEKHEGTLIPF